MGDLRCVASTEEMIQCAWEGGRARRGGRVRTGEPTHPACARCARSQGPGPPVNSSTQGRAARAQISGPRGSAPENDPSDGHARQNRASFGARTGAVRSPAAMQHDWFLWLHSSGCPRGAAARAGAAGTPCGQHTVPGARPSVGSGTAPNRLGGVSRRPCSRRARHLGR